MRNLLSRIERLMSPLKQRNRANAARTLNQTSNGECGLSEELKACRPTCEPTCDDPSRICSTSCGQATCTCEPGFVRHAGMCIPATACRFFDMDAKSKKKVVKQTSLLRAPSAKKMSSSASMTSATASILHRPLRPPPNCGQGQQFTRCVCDASCTNNKVCPTCASGCGCFLHHVRNDQGVCVLFRDCPFPRPKKKPMSMVLFVDPESGAVVSPKRVAALSRVLAREKAVKNQSIRTAFAISSADLLKGSRVEPPVKQARQKLLVRSISKTSTSDTGEHSAVFSPSKPAVERKPEKIVQRNSSSAGPTPPTPSPTPGKVKHHSRGPPAARPPHFGPPGITPFLLFRAKRIRRKENSLRVLRARMKRFRAL